MACHAFSMGIHDDDVLSAVLLHDVYEDCHVDLSDIDCNDRVRHSVALLSRNSYSGDNAEQLYYEGIKADYIASVVKCLDRVHNVSCMAQGFTPQRIEKYIIETEQHVLPILDNLLAQDSSFNAAWLMKYQLLSLLETFKRLI